MTKFSETLKDSFEVFSANPKFIIPKLLIAILNIFLLIATADLTNQFVVAQEFDTLTPLLANVTLIFVGTLIVTLIDLFVGSMYPFMVEQVKNKKSLDLRAAFSSAWKKIGVTMPTLIGIELAFILFAFIVSVPLAMLFVEEFDYFVLFSGVYLVLILIIVFFFYLIYPIVALEKNSAVASIRKSIAFSLKNKGDVAKATVISFLLSAISFGLAFLIEFFPASEESGFFWVAFVIVRFLTAYVYSYLFVLNPVFYLHYVKQK